MQAVKEGNLLLDAEAEAKGTKPAPSSVSSVKPDSKTSVQDNLATKSTNPYARARGELLSKMSPTARTVIQAMEAGTMKKDARYDKFLLQISELGDKLSS